MWNKVKDNVKKRKWLKRWDSNYQHEYYEEEGTGRVTWTPHGASVASVTESGDLTGATAIGLPANARPSSVSKSPLPRPSSDLTDLDGPSGAVNSSTTEQRRSSIWDRDKAHPVLKDPVWQADKRRGGSSASDKSEKKTVFRFSPRKNSGSDGVSNPLQMAPKPKKVGLGGVSKRQSALVDFRESVDLAKQTGIKPPPGKSSKGRKGTMATIKSGSLSFKDLLNSKKYTSDSSFDADSQSDDDDSSSDSEKEEEVLGAGDSRKSTITSTQSSGEIVTTAESRITLGTGMAGVDNKFATQQFDTYENPMNDPNSRKANFAKKLKSMKNSVRSMRINTLWSKFDDGNEDDDGGDEGVEMSDMDKKKKRKKRRKKKKDRKHRDDFARSRSLTQMTNSAWKGSKRYVKETYKWSTTKRAGIYTCRLIALLIVMGLGVMTALQFLVDGVDPFGENTKGVIEDEDGGGGIGGNPDWDPEVEKVLLFCACQNDVSFIRSVLYDGEIQLTPDTKLHSVRASLENLFDIPVLSIDSAIITSAHSQLEVKVQPTKFTPVMDPTLCGIRSYVMGGPLVDPVDFRRSDLSPFNLKMDDGIGILRYMTSKKESAAVIKSKDHQFDDRVMSALYPYYIESFEITGRATVPALNEPTAWNRNPLPRDPLYLTHEFGAVSNAEATVDIAFDGTMTVTIPNVGGSFLHMYQLTCYDVPKFVFDITVRPNTLTAVYTVGVPPLGTSAAAYGWETAPNAKISVTGEAMFLQQDR
jgi:hypothetical protein